MASELRVDRIIPTSGVPTNGGGSILQIMPVYGLATPLVSSTTTSYESMWLIMIRKDMYLLDLM